MIHASFSLPAVVEAAEGDAPSRTVGGLAVPWNVEGRVSSGQRVKFLPGSLDAASRPVLLRDHDRSRPLGRVTEATDGDDGMAVSARISAVSAGDEALVLASDGVLSMFSVGADPTKFHYEDDVLVVEAADWQELSLLPLGAFPTATVTSVAAALPEEATVPEAQLETAPPEPVVTASGPTPLPLTTAAPVPSRDLSIRGISRMIAAGAKAADIMAALTDIKVADLDGAGKQGLFQIAFSEEVRGLVEYGRPTINAIDRAALPPNGMRVEWPVWATLPLVDIQAAEKTQVASGPATINQLGADVLTFAGANDISLQAAQRSNPSFVEKYLQAMVEIYNRKTNGYVITSLAAIAAPVAPATTFVDTIEAVVSAFDPLTISAGDLFFGLSWDVAATLIGVTGLNGPAFWTINLNLSGLPQGVSGGLNVYLDRQLPAKTILAGVSGGATWYEDPAAPVELRVVDVSILGLDVGVYGFAALGIENVNAFKKVTFTTLPTMAATSSSKK